MKTIITTLCAAIVLGSNLLVANSDTVPLRYSDKAQYMVLANQIGTAYHTNVPLIKAVVTCESSWSAGATNVSKKEQSYGLVQINRLAHPSISIQQAEDPSFALNYLAKGLSTGSDHWTCQKMVKYKSTH